MRYIAALILSLFTLTCNAEKIDVECWSASKQIFHNQVNEVLHGDGFIITKDKNHTNFISGDCIVIYTNPKRK